MKDTLDSYMFSIIDGHEMESCEKLKEIYMDNTEFRSIFFRGDLSLHEKMFTDWKAGKSHIICCFISLVHLMSLQVPLVDVR